jgi:hypothetical protein
MARAPHTHGFAFGSPGFTLAASLTDYSYYTEQREHPFFLERPRRFWFRQRIVSKDAGLIHGRTS